MVFFLVFIIIIALIKIRPQKFSDGQNTYLSKDNTTCILGIFALIIFLFSFFSYIPDNSLNILDKPAKGFVSLLGQLMVVPFLFYSGYGIYEQYKLKGEEYANEIPKRRILKVFLMFILAWLLFVVLALYQNAKYGISDYILSLFLVKSIGNNNWFILVILVLYFISFISFKFINSKKIFLIIHFCLCLFFYFLLKWIGYSPYWYNTLFAYFFGIVFSIFKDKFEYKFSTRKKTIIGLLISLMLFFIFYYLVPKFLNYSLISEFSYFLCVFSFCLILLFLTRLISIKNKILLFFGKNCFWIYILQRLPMIAFQNTVLGNNKYVYFVISFLITIILSFIFSKVFNFLWNLIYENKGKTTEQTNIRVGIAISYIALGVSVIGGLIITPKILSAIGSEQYGLYSFASSITAWLGVITTALGASYIRFVTKEAKERENGEAVTNKIYFKLFAFFAAAIFLIVSIVSLLLFVCKFRLPQYTDEENILIIILLFVSGINIAISILFSTFSHYCTYKKQFIFIRSLALIISILTYAVNLVLALTTKSVVFIAVSTTLLTLLSNIIILIYSKKNQNICFDKESTFKKEKNLLKSITIFSSFILLNSIVDQINYNVDKTILGILVDANSVTVYTLSKYFNSFLLTMSTSISSTYCPKIHELVLNNKKEELNALFLRTCKIQSIVILLAVGGFISCGRFFVPLWLGKGYDSVYSYACVLLSLEVIPLTVNFGIEVQRAMNKHKFRAVLYIIMALMNVAISILLVKFLPREYAIWGTIIGTVFSVTIGNCIILNIYNKKVIGLPMGKYFLNLFKIILITGIGVGAAFGISFILPEQFSLLFKTFITGCLFLFIYSLFLILFERKIAFSIIKKNCKRF